MAKADRDPMNIALQKSPNQGVVPLLLSGFVLLNVLGALLVGFVSLVTSWGLVTPAQQPWVVLFGAVPLLLGGVFVTVRVRSYFIGPRFGATLTLIDQELTVRRKNDDAIVLRSPTGRLDLVALHVRGPGSGEGGRSIGPALELGDGQRTTTIATLEPRLVWPGSPPSRMIVDWLCQPEDFERLARHLGLPSLGAARSQSASP